MSAAPVYVNRPTAPDASRFGLLSIATFPTDGGDRAVYNGIEYDLPPAPEATLDPAACIGTDDDPLDWDTAGSRGKPTGESDPIRAWAGFECAAVGLSEPDVADYVRAKLAAAEGPFLEKAIWDDTTPSIVAEATDLSSAGAVPLEVGIGRLEAWLYENYAGVGALHLPRHLGAVADEAGIIHQQGTRMTTKLGTPAAFGAYPNVNTDGDAETDAGVYWLAATGDVSIRRSDIRVTARVDHRRNNWHAIAERSYVLAFDETAAMLPVVVPALTGGGNG